VPLFPSEPGVNIDPGLLIGLPERVAHLKLTSGTTGTPRAVLFTAEQLIADADQIVDTMGLLDHGQNVSTVSLAHSYGFSSLVLPLLLHGIPLVIVDSPLPAAVDAALTLSGADSIVPAVPAMWQAWAGAGILSGERLGLAISAGAPLGADLEREIYNSHGLKIHNFLGSSECGGIAYDRSSTPRTRPEQVGTPMEGVTVDLERGNTLVVRSPAAGLRYWPDDAPEKLGRGSFSTSDIAAIDRDGSIRLLGRAGDGINVAGRKASPAEIEAALIALEGVHHCAVFGVPSKDPARCEEIVACVNGSARESELKAALAKNLARWMVPRRWWFCEDLKPDARGKIARRVWRERFLDSSGH
jgi:acyl-coenzyme A synthetase/AMP-(fatty) acid ligase